MLVHKSLRETIRHWNAALLANLVRMHRKCLKPIPCNKLPQQSIGCAINARIKPVNPMQSAQWCRTNRSAPTWWWWPCKHDNATHPFRAVFFCGAPHMPKNPPGFQLIESIVLSAHNLYVLAGKRRDDKTLSCYPRSLPATWNGCTVSHCVKLF